MASLFSRVSRPDTLFISLLALMLVACNANAAPTTVPQPIANQVTSQNIAALARTAAPTPTIVSAQLVAEADAAQQVLINIYQRIDPAVVNIEISTTDNGQTDASGSGFVIDMDGHIVTNNHVIDKAKSITVTFYDGYTTPAKLVGADDFSDLAVIKVDVTPDHLTAVTFGDSSALQVGQRVIAIGNPFGLQSSMTTGIVSATGRSLNSSNLQFSLPSIIQIDAAINPGNSGGPLLDINGKVIGINAAISTDNGFFQGVGFAIPSNTVQRVVPQLIKTGKAEFSWLGIESIGGSGGRGLNVASLAEQLKLPVDHGVMVSSVLPNSPAATAGLRGGDQTAKIRGVDVRYGGDIITAINGQLLRDFDALIAYLVSNTAPGDTVTLSVVRGDQTIDIKVVLQARPKAGN